MEYVDGGGYIKLVASEAFRRDVIASGSTAIGTIIGALIGLLGGPVGSIVGGAIGGSIGWVIGGSISRGVYGDMVVYEGWIPKYDLGYKYLR